MLPAEFFMSLTGPREIRLGSRERERFKTKTGKTIFKPRWQSFYPTSLGETEAVLQQAETLERNVYFTLNKPDAVPMKAGSSGSNHIGGNAPAAPPMTMFCGVERLSHIE